MNYNYKLKISLKHIIDYNYTSQPLKPHKHKLTKIPSTPKSVITH